MCPVHDIGQQQHQINMYKFKFFLTTTTTTTAAQQNTKHRKKINGKSEKFIYGFIGMDIYQMTI